MIRIMIVDDQPLVREGLSTLLGLRSEIEVVGTAMDGKDALYKAVELLPDIMLMDIRMPGVNGVEGTRLLKDSLPDVKVLILTTFNDSEYIFDALEEGANGYLLKDMPTDTIVQAILTVYHGGVVLPKEFTSQVLTELRMKSQTSQEELPKGLEGLSDGKRRY